MSEKKLKCLNCGYRYNLIEIGKDTYLCEFCFYNKAKRE